MEYRPDHALAEVAGARVRIRAGQGATSQSRGSALAALQGQSGQAVEALLGGTGQDSTRLRRDGGGVLRAPVAVRGAIVVTLRRGGLLDRDCKAEKALGGSCGLLGRSLGCLGVAPAEAHGGGATGQVGSPVARRAGVCEVAGGSVSFFGQGGAFVPESGAATTTVVATRGLISLRLEGRLATAFRIWSLHQGKLRCLSGDALGTADHQRDALEGSPSTAIGCAIAAVIFEPTGRPLRAVSASGASKGSRAFRDGVRSDAESGPDGPYPICAEEGGPTTGENGYAAGAEAGAGLRTYGLTRGPCPSGRPTSRPIAPIGARGLTAQIWATITGVTTQNRAFTRLLSRGRRACAPLSHHGLRSLGQAGPVGLSLPVSCGPVTVFNGGLRAAARPSASRRISSVKTVPPLATQRWHFRTPAQGLGEGLVTHGPKGLGGPPLGLDSPIGGHAVEPHKGLSATGPL